MAYLVNVYRKKKLPAPPKREATGRQFGGIKACLRSQYGALLDIDGAILTDGHHIKLKSRRS